MIGYEAAYQMVETGEDVEKLILFDLPCPINLEAIPHRLYEFFSDSGILGSGGEASSSWLLLHFESSITNPKQNDPKKAPETLAIWVIDAIGNIPADLRPPPFNDDPKPLKWLLNNITGFTYNG